MPDPRDTPAMRQFACFKQRHPDCVLLFRVGDFYETFDDDAVTVSKALGLTLTKRTEGVPMAGVPYHQLESYLRRLIRLGFRVAVCDQVQDPREVKSGQIVARAVTRVITPGTLVDDGLLDAGSSNKLAAVVMNDRPGGVPPRGGGKSRRSPNAGSGPGPTPAENAAVSVAVVEASTGAFTIFDCPLPALGDELASRGVHELLHSDAPEEPLASALRTLPIARTPRPGWHFRHAEAIEAVTGQFKVKTLAGFGLGDDDPSIPPAGAVIRYLQETQAACEDDPQIVGVHGTANQGSSKHPVMSARRPTLAHLLPPRREDPGGVCTLDSVSLRALEVERTIRGGAGPGTPTGSPIEGSLLGVFTGPGGQGGCRTAMGRRLVREWLCRPLAKLDAIADRHAGVAVLVEDRRTAEALGGSLDRVQDIARIAGRVALGRATPRDLVALGASLGRIDRIAGVIDGAPAFASRLSTIRVLHADLEPIARDIATRCVEAPPPHLREGGLFRDGIDATLDESRLLQRDATAWLTAYQARLISEHGLPSLKVGFNSIFGYYIELPSAQSKRAPAEFSRKQTLTKAERYTTPELKTFETKVTTAQERAIDRERQLFDELAGGAAAVIPAISAFARIVAELDVLLCFADKAVRSGWTRPEMTDEPVLVVAGGRHPVLEETLGDRFVPNDAALGRDEETEGQRDPDPASDRVQSATPDDVSPSHRLTVSPSLALITGPNMAGKSTFIRQTALIVLLAHAGAFVPAERATIGLTDRIFTRVGADDALHAGQSTFLVEMVETANILNHATGRSLVILDEIGRGTSTLDGLSLAWAIAERLAGEGDRPGPRTLFATHYHELTELEERLPGRVRNLHVSVREWGEQIVFLHRILPGRTDRSYGIHVAKLAGLPESVVARAREVLESLAVHHGPAASRERTKAVPSAPPPNGQLGLFTEFVPHPAVDELREIKLDALSPMQAFDALRRLKGMTEAADA
ncbi:MAG: DNA mismatch repair protein MutS [Phycisphaerales bacterium]